MLPAACTTLRYPTVIGEYPQMQSLRQHNLAEGVEGAEGAEGAEVD